MSSQSLLVELCGLFERYGCEEVVLRLRRKRAMLRAAPRAALSNYLQLLAEEIDYRILDDDRGDTLLIKAIRAHDTSAILFLIKINADLNKPNMLLHSPIQVAHDSNHLDIAILLIRNGADYSPIIMHLTLLPVIYKHCPSKLDFLKLIRNTSEYDHYLRNYNNETLLDIKSPTYERKVSLTFVRPCIRVKSQQFIMEIKEQSKKIDGK